MELGHRRKHLREFDDGWRQDIFGDVAGQEHEAVFPPMLNCSIEISQGGNQRILEVHDGT